MDMVAQYNFLADMLTYVPDTGKFYWKKKPNRRINLGEEAGGRTLGYIKICYKGVRIHAHRLAFFCVHGQPPQGQIDHINRVKDDNRIVNLRECKPHENRANAALGSNNTSGVKGVNWCVDRSKWLVRVMHQGVRHHVGYFFTLNEAAKAYDQKAKELCSEFVWLNNGDNDANIPQ